MNLRKYGCDFSLIATRMSKSRDEIKKKFKSFEKTNEEIALQIFRQFDSDQKEWWFRIWLFQIIFIWTFQ